MAKYGMPGAEDDADDADEEEAGGQAGAAGWEGSPPRPGTAVRRLAAEQRWL